MIVRVDQDEGYVFLYSNLGDERRENILGHFRGILFTGIYCKENGRLYYWETYKSRDVCALMKLCTDFQPTPIDDLLNTATKDIRSAVETVMNKDELDIGIEKITQIAQITQITDVRLLDHLAYYYENDARRDARTAYITNKTLEDLVYKCDHDYHDLENWEPEMVKEYILDPITFVAKEALKYVANNQEKLLSWRLENDAMRAEYRKIIDDPSNPVHLVKKIREAVSETSMNTNTRINTVRVAICKEGKSFAFRTKVDSLRYLLNDYPFYYTWHIETKDRKEFERLFGNDEEHGPARYGPSDIVTISYGNKVLYKAE
jgi:hypothetical protein